METARLRATVLGDLEAAHESVTQALAAMPRSVPSLSGTATTAQLAMAAGSPLPPIRDILIEAVSAAEPADDGDPALHAVFLLLFYVCLLTADPEDWAALSTTSTGLLRTGAQRSDCFATSFQTSHT